MGGSVTDYGGLYRYLDAVEESPRLRISTFGETFEHRELILLTISSPENLARLDAIQHDTRRLADPRGLAEDDSEAIIARTPAGVFLNYGNDGNESAAFEAALWMAWELLSGRHDESLDDVVVYIVPASNPDSHERFAAWFKATASWPDGDPDPNAVEPAEEEQPAEVIPGAILRALPNPESVLSFGYEDAFPVMVWSSLAFEPDPAVAAAARFPDDPDELLGSGFAFPDSLARLAGTPYLVTERVGSGRVVLFLDDPNFRLFWDGLTRLFMNAVLFGPSF